MSTSYGTITITDTTDLGQLSVFLTGSTVRQQIYDANTSPVSYYPDWSSVPIVITPHVNFNGRSENLGSNRIEVSWSKEERGVAYPNTNVPEFPSTPTSTACPESAVGTSQKELQRPANLALNSAGATYTATVTYYPIDNDRSVFLQAIATLDLTIANNGLTGADGQPGAAAKSLQLISSGSSFSYDWQGNAIGVTTIDLSVEKSSNIAGVHWYCDNTLIQQNGSPLTSLTLRVTTNNISTYSPNFSTNRSATFKVVETNNSGVEITDANGFVDYATIYKLQDAQPGSSTYSSYLDNDQETVNEYNGQIDFSNAITTFYLDKGGVNDLVQDSGWTITITDSNTQSNPNSIVYTTGKSTFNTLPSGNNNKVTAVTSMSGTSAWIRFTAENSDPNISDQIKTFTINKNPSLVGHALRLDSVVSNRNVNTFAYEPAQIIADAIVRTGGGTNPYHETSNLIIATITYTDNTTTSVANTAGNPCYINLADKISGTTHYPIKNITVELNYNSSIVDSQTIVITSNGTDGIDGNDGESPWTFMIGNQFDEISTDYGYNVSRDYQIKIPVRAAQGTIEKTIHRGGSEYPTIVAPTILTDVIPHYYNNNTEVSTTGATVNNIRYIIPANKNLGSSGTGEIELALTYASDSTLRQSYTYKAQPEPLKPIRVLLSASPTDTFENQNGTITITPMVMSGTSEITSGLTYPEGGPWKVFDNGTWKTIAAAAIEGITVNNTTKVLSVVGTAVQGFLGFSYTVIVSRGGNTESYTENINIKDIDDPLQVSLHSTVGEQIVNGQGVGVLYARVIRRGEQEDLDSIRPDNMLGVGAEVPQNTADFSGKTGYFRIIKSSNVPTGQIDYYWRDSTNTDWQGPRASSAQQFTYTWTFRDANNAPYSKTANETPAPIKYAMNHNTQFVYIDSSVVNNKITAVVKVES